MTIWHRNKRGRGCTTPRCRSRNIANNTFSEGWLQNSNEFAGLRTAPATHHAKNTANTTFSCGMLQNAGFGTIPCGGGGGVVANREPGSYICLYLIPVKLSLEGTSFPCPYPLSFFSWHAPILCCLISTYFISPYQLRCCVLEIGWPRPLPTGPTHSTGGSGLSLLYLYPESIDTFPSLSYLI